MTSLYGGIQYLVYLSGCGVLWKYRLYDGIRGAGAHLLLNVHIDPYLVAGVELLAGEEAVQCRTL